MESLGRYYDYVRVSMRLAGGIKWFLFAGWVLLPVCVQTIMHPTDAAGFGYWINGDAVPRFYSSRQVINGELMAVFAFVALIFVYLVVTVLFFRRVRFWVSLWPLAMLIAGFLDNGAWWIYYNGVFDPSGAVAGFMPMVLAGLSVALCHKLGADFVFGPENRPLLEDTEAHYQ
jgi:hypothetical protein